MPLYEYECQKCGKLTEILQSHAKADNVDNEVKCPECGSFEMRRKFSTFGVVMGTGKAGSAESAASCPTGACTLPPMS